MSASAAQFYSDYGLGSRSDYHSGVRTRRIATGNRWFESSSLQRRVNSELFRRRWGVATENRIRAGADTAMGYPCREAEVDGEIARLVERFAFAGQLR